MQYVPTLKEIELVFTANSINLKRLVTKQLFSFLQKKMSIKTAKPSQILQPFIKQYWSIENVLPRGEKHIQRITPKQFFDKNEAYSDFFE